MSLEEKKPQEKPAEVSAPSNFVHHGGIRFNDEGEVVGVPSAVVEALAKEGISLETVLKNPGSADMNKLTEILYKLNLQDVLGEPKASEPEKIEVSAPSNFVHHGGIRFNENGEVVGVPKEVVEALAKEGITIEALLKNPGSADVAKINEILYKLNLQDVLGNK